MSKRAWSGLIGIVLAWALAAPLWADSNVRIVRLSLVDGPVQLDRGTGQGFERAIMNMPITSGMRLWTRDDSRAEIEFEQGSTVRMTPGTRLDFSELALRDDGTRATVVTIEDGEAYVTYRHKKGEDFRIRAGNREIDLTKPVELRINVNPQRADIAVLGGELLADGVKVKKNHTAVLDFTGGAYQVAEGITPGAEDAWNHERDQYEQTYARSAYRGASFYGVSDLNYYGSWYDSPYGSCWRPYGFSSSWNPYSSGAWVLYPGYGYSWVSLYPWGWQPFRMGAWNYASGLGYCWTPMRSYYGLGWAPVYHAPNGFVQPQPPAKPPVVPPPHKGPWPPPSGIAGEPTIHEGPDGRLPRTILPVGDVDAQTWELRHHRGLPVWRGDRAAGGAAVAGSSGATGAPVNNRVVPAGPRSHRGADFPAYRGPERNPMPSARPDRPSPSPRMSAPRMAPPPREAPRMSAPPRMEAPRMEAPRMEAPRSAPSPHEPSKK